MNNTKKLISFLIAAGMFLLIFPQTAYAYYDPGTMSLIYQMIMAAVLGISLFVRIFWGKIKTFFSGLFSKKQETKNAGE